ncbi:hypothetical protein lerEdw1_001223 [Lerista edwardsae]|nr:hypothetical protein lerEdw1_001225 [Lerista edwardsae]KAJ6650979.1 hypothetical protein lerEdw1_001223 [Lerista edwardsae]
MSVRCLISNCGDSLKLQADGARNEEVRFIENELEHQKQKYFELQAFTRSLILAIKTDDKEQQQALLADLPPELEEMDFNHASPGPDDTSFSLSSSSEKNALDSL